MRPLQRLVCALDHLRREKRKRSPRGEGLELVRAVRTVGRFLRWVAIGVLALLLGAVSLYENLVKIFGWLNQPK
ncbi:hypothetical protein [Phyllobacterium phragmitis]|uniref:Uncharacterized protein n=1 Tax=Phyllobacterium phragmitis TaxID=2670329 RepID=A0ABQ0H558_9HYPH